MKFIYAVVVILTLFLLGCLAVLEVKYGWEINWWAMVPFGVALSLMMWRAKVLLDE